MNKNEQTLTVQVKLWLFLSVISMMAAILTLIPYGAAGKANVIGYHSLCTFTPVSTIVCFFASRAFYTLFKKKSGKEPTPEKGRAD